MGHGDYDLGVTAISYNHERASFIDFTFQVGLDGTVWVSRPPQPLPPIRNISMIFDIPSWIFIIVSVILVTTTLIIIVSFNNTGLGTSVRIADVLFICLRDSLIYFRRESKQPNGCFSLWWTQYITASERVDVTPPPLSSPLNSLELSFELF